MEKVHVGVEALNLHPLYIPWRRYMHTCMFIMKLWICAPFTSHRESICSCWSTKPVHFIDSTEDKFKRWEGDFDISYEHTFGQISTTQFCIITDNEYWLVLGCCGTARMHQSVFCSLRNYLSNRLFSNSENFHEDCVLLLVTTSAVKLWLQGIVKFTPFPTGVKILSFSDISWAAFFNLVVSDTGLQHGLRNHQSNFTIVGTAIFILSAWGRRGLQNLKACNVIYFANIMVY